MLSADEIAITVQTDDGPIRALIARTTLARLSGRSHVTPEEVVAAFRIEIEDIVRRTAARRREASEIRLTNNDL